MKVGTDGVLLGAWTNVADAKRILDIGTGTGLIALMIAQRNPTARIDAIEIDQESAAEALQNVGHSPWAGRVSIVHDSIQNFSSSTTITYDLIVSNPPFFNAGTASPSANRHQARHTGELPQRDLIEAVNKILSPNGKFCVILPVTESEAFTRMTAESNLLISRKTVFFPKAHKLPERHLIEFTRTGNRFEEDSLIQYNEDGEWTDAYKNLTRDFHTKL